MGFVSAAFKSWLRKLGTLLRDEDHSYKHRQRPAMRFEQLESRAMLSATELFVDDAEIGYDEIGSAWVAGSLAGGFEGDYRAAIEQLKIALAGGGGNFYEMSSVEARLRELRELAESQEKDK